MRGLVVLADGHVAVLDASAQDVRVFGPDGTHIVTHARQGEGPGELVGAHGLMSDRAGRIWVPDGRNARMSVFHRDDGFIESYPMPFLTRGFVWQGLMMADGTIWKPSIELETRRNILRVYSDSMTLVDSLPLPDDPPEVDTEDPPGSFVWRDPSGVGRAYFSVPYFPQGQTLIDPRGEVWSTAYGDASYRIARWVPGGDTTLILEALRPPVSIPGEERDSAIAAVRESMRDFGAAREDRSKMPTVRPAIESTFLSEEGELFVRSRRESGEIFDVFGRDGRHVRTIQNPLPLYRWLRPTVRGDDFWGVVTDDLGVHYVVHAKIRPTVEGGR